MPATTNQQVLSVSEVVSLINSLFREMYPLCVQGEISESKVYPSGHWYFTLKDSGAQLKCAMWKSTLRTVSKIPQIGTLVKVYGGIEVYGKTGSLSFIARKIELAGEGYLYEEFLKLKSKLEAQGLFDQKVKKPIVRIPKRIGIVTSIKAAALQDVLNRIKDRAPYVEIDLYPAQVQGETASGTLVRAIQRANEYNRVDTLLLVRGGGSLQDLWCFNDEKLVYAIRASTIPIIAGIGHETDVTLADLAADLRAPTPTAAAEKAAEKKEVLLSELASKWQPMHSSIVSKMNRAEQDLIYFSKFYESSKTFLSPLYRNVELAWSFKSFPFAKYEKDFSSTMGVIRSLLQNKLDGLLEEINKTETWLEQRTHSIYTGLENQFVKVLQGFRISKPTIDFSTVQRQIDFVSKYAAFKMKSNADRLRIVNQAMTMLDPKKMRAGVAFVFKDGKNITSITQLKPSDLINIMLPDGNFDARVGTINKANLGKDKDN